MQIDDSEKSVRAPHTELNFLRANCRRLALIFLKTFSFAGLQKGSGPFASRHVLLRAHLNSTFVRAEISIQFFRMR